MKDCNWPSPPYLIAPESKTFIYALGPGGTNTFWGNIFAAGKERATKSECEAVTRLFASSPRLFDALEHAENILRRVAKESGLTHSDAESCADEALAALSEAVGFDIGES